MATPFISPLKTSSGTFYSLISPSKDITSQFGDDQKVLLSNFVCLNIPKINVQPISGENYLQLNGIQSAVNSGIENVSDLNISLAQHFQNYILNFEQLTLDNPNYVKSKKSTGERIFFKWLNEVGAMRYRTANFLEKNSSINEERYVEEDESAIYKRVVKFIGDISVTNVVEKGSISYQESYILIPSNTGYTPTVLFKTESDPNYNLGNKFLGTNEFIEGRDSSSSHPDGLSISAYYDDDVDNSYNTRVSFNDSTNYTKNIVLSNSNLEFISSNLDGVGIDFDPFSYNQIVSNPNINSISEFNSTPLSGDFEFNVILIYYRVYNRNNPLDFETNLFGVYFIDRITQTALDGAFIQSVKKYKFDADNSQIGNSWGLKLNLQISSNSKDNTIETIMNEYNTFSMSMFMETSVMLQNLLDTTQEYQLRLVNLENRVNALESYVSSNNNVFALKSEFDQLVEDFNNSNVLFSNTDSILELISQLSDKVNAIINGDVNSNVSLDFSKISAGSGIKLDKSNFKIEISSEATSYNSPQLTEFQEISYETVHILRNLNNYHKIVTSEIFTFNKDYKFIVDNKLTTNWKVGQCIDISLGFILDLGIFEFQIFTYDLKGELIKIYVMNNFNKKNNIKIVCIDDVESIFSIDTY